MNILEEFQELMEDVVLLEKSEKFIDEYGNIKFNIEKIIFNAIIEEQGTNIYKATANGYKTDIKIYSYRELFENKEIEVEGVKFIVKKCIKCYGHYESEGEKANV